MAEQRRFSGKEGAQRRRVSQLGGKGPLEANIGVACGLRVMCEGDGNPMGKKDKGESAGRVFVMAWLRQKVRDPRD